MAKKEWIEIFFRFYKFKKSIKIFSDFVHLYFLLKTYILIVDEMYLKPFDFKE